MPCSLTTNNRPRTPSLRAFRRRSAVRPAQNAISMPCSYHITREATTRHKSRPVSGEMERGDHADIYAVYSVASHEVRSTSSGRVRCRFANEESQSSRSTIHDMLHEPFLVSGVVLRQDATPCCCPSSDTSLYWSFCRSPLAKLCSRTPG